MKKIMLSVVAATAMLATSCDSSAPKADLSTSTDTLSYAIGAANAGSPDQLAEFLQAQGLDTSLVDEVLKGIGDALNADDKKLLAYHAGLAIGSNIRASLQKAGPQLLGDSTATLSYKNVAAGFVEVMKGQVSLKDSAGKPFDAMAFQQVIESVSTQIKAKKFEGNIKKSADFIASKAKEAGIKQLAPGVYYKEIKAGTGAVAKDGQLINMHYEGKTIDGKVFDSSIQRGTPVEFAVGAAIPGFNEVLKRIPMGAKWEIYLAADQAYGAQSPNPSIEPYSALQFTVEAISVKDAPKQAANGLNIDPAQLQGEIIQ